MILEKQGRKQEAFDCYKRATLRAREVGCAGDRGFVLRLAERVKIMGLSKTNVPALGPRR